jgi:hypothetical protein
MRSAQWRICRFAEPSILAEELRPGKPRFLVDLEIEVSTGSDCGPVKIQAVSINANGLTVSGTRDPTCAQRSLRTSNLTPKIAKPRLPLLMFSGLRSEPS